MCRRAGKTSKRGLSDEQVPILVALDRSGTTTCSVLPSVTADNVQAVLEPRMDDDILLVTDGNIIYPPCAKSPGIKHEALNQSAGERVRGAIHIQTVNNRHSRFKDFLRRFRGVSIKYLGIYLHWFERYEIAKSSPRSYLATATGGPCIRFSNCAKFISRILLYKYLTLGKHRVHASPSRTRFLTENANDDTMPCFSGIMARMKMSFHLDTNKYRPTSILAHLGYGTGHHKGLANHCR